MNIPSIAARAVATGFRVASSVIPQARFVLNTGAGLDPVHDTLDPFPVEKTVPVLAYSDEWRTEDGDNVLTDMLMVQVWRDGTPVPTVNDYVIFKGVMRKLASIKADLAGATWIIALVAPSGVMTTV